MTKPGEEQAEEWRGPWAAEAVLEAMRAALKEISQPHDHKDGKPYSHTEELTFVRHLARAALNPLPPEQA